MLMEATGNAIFYILFLVRPFSTIDLGSKSEDIASSWNASISRLGISPIFPPQEDFYVGDIWAVIVDSESMTRLAPSAMQWAGLTSLHQWVVAWTAWHQLDS
jgi:hypothetical protein